LNVALGAAILGWGAVKYYTYHQTEAESIRFQEEFRKIQRNIQTLTQQKDHLDLWQDRYTMLMELDRYVNLEQITGHLAQHSPSLIYLEEMKFIPEQSGGGSVGAIPGTPGIAQTAKGSRMFLLNQTAQGPGFAETENTPETGKGTKAPTLLMYLKGKAYNYQAVADYLTVLRNSRFFQHVHLKRSGRQTQGASPNKETYAAAEIIEFEIECPVQPLHRPEGVNYASVSQTQNF
jgi:Tfp pilus assembly protein PilN